MSVEELANPPEPPEIERKVRLHRFQWIGVPVLVLAPVLALFGVFGESWSTQRLRSDSLALTVEWPTRFRYKQINEIRVRIENLTGTPFDTVTVSVDTAYAGRFSTVRAIPGFDEPYRLSLTDVRPGRGALAVIELQAEEYGRHSGVLTVAARDTLRVRLHTTIFP